MGCERETLETRVDQAKRSVAINCKNNASVDDTYLTQSWRVLKAAGAKCTFKLALSFMRRNSKRTWEQVDEMTTIELQTPVIKALLQRCSFFVTAGDTSDMDS